MEVIYFSSYNKENSSVIMICNARTIHVDVLMTIIQIGHFSQ